MSLLRSAQARVAVSRLRWTRTFSVSAAHKFVTASPDGYREVADILADGFRDDPLMNWLIEDRSYYPRIFAHELETTFGKHNHVFVNEEGTGAQVCLPPGVDYKPASPDFGTLSLLGDMTWKHGFGPLKRLLYLDKTFVGAHPKEPHFYFHAGCARHGYQRQGIGDAMIQHVTKMCDEQQKLAYMESSNISNNAFFERHGFQVTREITLPDGPTICLMERQPQDPEVSQ